MEGGGLSDGGPRLVRGMEQEVLRLQREMQNLFGDFTRARAGRLPASIRRSTSRATTEFRRPSWATR